MYISKLALNERDRLVRTDLSNIHKLHQRIMQGFPDIQQQQVRADWNILFRLEPDSNIILVQSGAEIAPDWDKLPQDYLLDRDTKPMTLHPDNFTLDRLFHFRLQANPSKRDKNTHKTVGLYHRPDQIVWLERQALNHGFRVETVDAIPTPNIFGKKKNGDAPINIHSVMFQGVLKVCDADLLLQAIQTGIGRGKAYGCGLLSLQRIAPN